MKEFPQDNLEDGSLDGTEIIRRTVLATIAVYEDLGIIMTSDEMQSVPLEEIQGRVERFKEGLLKKGENPDKFFAKLIIEKIEENNH